MSNLFREKSIQRISSPEQLNAYIRVFTPSVWLLLPAIVLLLAGVCVWGVLGHMDTTLPALAVCREGNVTAYVRREDVEKIADPKITINGMETDVRAMGMQSVCVDESFTEYMRHVGGLQEGEWLWPIELDASLPDGVYTAQITIDSVSPMSFVLN